MARILLLSILALKAVGVYYFFLKGPPSLPDFDLNEWWGPESKRGKQDTSVTPFKISFGDDLINDLKERLKHPRPFAPPLEGVGFQYGFNSQQLDSWLKYWAEKYDFKEREKFLNQFPHYKTNIQGLDIHFIRVTPQVPAGVEIVPLLLLHGWPGSVREFYEAIPLLTAVSKDRNFAIEVIAPSIPGFGFSDPAVRPGLGSPQVAVVYRNLMHRLGFKQFYVQGGDWGALIGSNIVTIFPKEILGYHTNMAIITSLTTTAVELLGSIYPPLIVESHLADRMYPVKDRFKDFLEETGYLHIQSTKPDTIGIALTDSPAGLLAYILEKFSSGTRLHYRTKPDGGLYSHFTKDQLLDNLMMYWASNSITTAMRLYSESFNIKTTALKMDEIPTPVPTWVFQAKYEIGYQPPFILKFKYKNLVNVTVLDDGGHFLALELPKIFADDVLKAIGEFRKLKKDTKTEL